MRSPACCNKTEAGATFVYRGDVDFQDWEGEAPISVAFRLRAAVPERLLRVFGVWSWTVGVPAHVVAPPLRREGRRGRGRPRSRGGGLPERVVSCVRI